ncbi:4812_t:CDS:1, partial [Diversispora eburnea]
ISPLSNRTSVPFLPTSKITFKTPLISNNYEVSNTHLFKKFKKSKVSIQKEINITDFEKNNPEKFEDNYPKVNITRYKGKRAYYYQYNILNLGSYPTNVQRTQRSRYRIPNGYCVQAYLYERDVICSINYEYNGK